MKKEITWRGQLHELDEHEYLVALTDGTMALVTIDEQYGAALDDGMMTERFPYEALVNLSRKAQAPRWLDQVPPLQQRIAGSPSPKRGPRGRSTHPHRNERWQNLPPQPEKWGTCERANADIKRQLERAGKMPRAFDDHARSTAARRFETQQSSSEV